MVRWHLSYPNLTMGINAFLRLGTIGICRAQTQQCIIDQLLRLSTNDASLTKLNDGVSMI